MRRGIVGLLLALTALVPARLPAHAATPEPAQRPDPCGLRHAMWGWVQEIADLTDAVNGGMDGYTFSVRDNYITLKQTGLEFDYGYRNGVPVLDKPASSVMGDLEAAIQDENQGQTDIGFYISDARKSQATLWAGVKSICSWNGKGFTWTGYADVYGYNQRDIYFTVPKGQWTLDYWFDCGDDSGNFIVNVYRNGQMSPRDVNKLAKSGSNLLFFPHPGNIHLSIISECAWNVKAAR